MDDPLYEGVSLEPATFGDPAEFPSEPEEDETIRRADQSEKGAC